MGFLVARARAREKRFFVIISIIQFAGSTTFISSARARVLSFPCANFWKTLPTPYEIYAKGTTCEQRPERETENGASVRRRSPVVFSRASSAVRPLEKKKIRASKGWQGGRGVPIRATRRGVVRGCFSPVNALCVIERFGPPSSSLYDG